jgi:membrane protein involved in D-alanine export
MTPYGDLFFFYIMFLALVPAIVLGLLGKRIKYYGIFVSLVMVLLFIGNNKLQLLSVLLFYVFQLILVKLYLYIRTKTDNRLIMRVFVFLSIAPLIISKASPYFTKSIVGFIGISYITFKTVQIIIETYDGLIKSMSITNFTYFLLFFPSLSSGPVDRSRNFEAHAQNAIDRDTYAGEYLTEGILRILKGVAYKFLIGNLINTLWLTKIPEAHSFVNTINYMYAYSLYLFFDFAGYSHMAIGTGRILGVKLPENFDAPFISRNMKEFWNRWHMSLSFWFRDYIFTRFVMESVRKKRFKSRYTASYIAYFLNMTIMGVWHGFKVFYVIYGVYMALALIITDYVQRKSKLYKKYKNKIWWKYCAIALNFHVACFGLLLFSGYLYNK